MSNVGLLKSNFENDFCFKFYIKNETDDFDKRTVSIRNPANSWFKTNLI